MLISNALIFRAGEFLPGELSFSDRIEPAKDGTSAALDAEGMYLMPGLIDIHTHGAAGADASFPQGNGMERLSLFYASNGVTSWCPTLMSLRKEDLLSAAKSFRDFRRPEKGAKCAGINMEGPFLSPAKRGSQRLESLSLPDEGLFMKAYEASGGSVRLLTVAPELPGAMELIKAAKEYVTVAIGHTEADYATGMKAFEAGASHLTHMYNAMPPLLSRDPGPIGAAMDSGATAELIADGRHVLAPAQRAAFRFFDGRLALISDSLPCCGLPEGVYAFDGRGVEVRDGAAYLAGTDTLAGGCTGLLECMRRAVRNGMPLEKAAAAVTSVPASVIGAEDVGTLESGHAADFILLDRDLALKAVFMDGVQIYGEKLKEKEIQR